MLRLVLSLSKGYGDDGDKAIWSAASSCQGPSHFPAASIHPLTVGNAYGQAFGHGLGGVAIGNDIITPLRIRRISGHFWAFLGTQY